MNVVVPPGCDVREVETHVAAVADGFVEQTSLEVLDRGGCAWVAVDLPPGAHLTAGTAKVRFGDDTRHRLGPERWVPAPRGVDDVGRVTLAVPELVRGDRVFLSFTRAWPTTGFVWRPDAIDARVALFDGRALPAGSAAIAGAAEPHPDRLRLVYLPAGPGGAPPGKVDPAAVGVAAPPAALPGAPSITGEDPAAWQDALAARWVAVPRGVDGATPLAGDAAIARGGGDDRGFARTLVARAQGTAHRVTLAWVPVGTPVDLPGGPPDAAVEVAVWTTDQGAVALWPPGVEVAPKLWAGADLADYTVRTVQSAAAGAPPTITRATTLSIPGKDPQIALYPGGAATAAVQATVALGASDTARVVFLPDAPGGPVDGLRARGDALVGLAPPSDEPATWTATWTIDDPAACGIAGPNDTIVDPDGRVRVQEGGWWLAEHAGLPVVPDRERVIKGLDRRFGFASLREPGLPTELKGLRADDPTAIPTLVRLLHERIRVVPLGGDPLLPRSLAVVRRDGVASPLEAALWLRVWAGQLGVPATWALARPVADGAPVGPCPSTYPTPLVVLWDGDREVWVDPACEVCAPGELPPRLGDAPLLSPGPTQAPAATPAGVTVVDAGRERTITLDGAAALRLRLALAPLPADARLPAIAAAVAGPGGQVVALDGFGALGAPVTIRVAGDALPPMPTAWP